MLRQTLTLTVITGAALAPAALAAPGGNPNAPGQSTASALSIDSVPNPVVFGTSTTLSGKLSGGSSAVGVTVRLERDDTLPLGDKYVPTGTTVVTTQGGAWSAPVTPSVNTLYRAVALTSPPTTSPVERVNVRPSITMRLSDSTPARGALVRFSGSVRPAHDDRTVRIQKRTSTGGWITVVRTNLNEAAGDRSTYSRRIRVRASGVYRVKLVEHADHTNGYSPRRTVVVH